MDLDGYLMAILFIVVVFASNQDESTNKIYADKWHKYALFQFICNYRELYIVKFDSPRPLHLPMESWIQWFHRDFCFFYDRNMNLCMI